MQAVRLLWRPVAVILLAVGTVGSVGCQSFGHTSKLPVDHKFLEHAEFPTAPKELCKTVLPPHVIEPPDILTINALRIVPRAPYSLQSLDIVAIAVDGTLPDEPINGPFRVEPGGMVNLGYGYGSVQIGGMTPEQAQDVIRTKLSERLREPRVSVTLVEVGALQEIAGQYLVAPDGTVNLGIYGKVCVVGLTVEQARATIERHLAMYLDNPQVSVDIFAYNSKVYYVFTEGAGLGDRVVRLPVTGNETVLDAISNINGLTQISSKKIWIARPTADKCDPQILPVHWEEITSLGVTNTNYQILPGDRVFIAEDKLVALDTSLAKLFAPAERIFGFSLLGANTVSRFSGNVLTGGGLRGAFGGGTNTVVVP